MNLDQEAEFIADNISIEEFTAMLNNTDKSFPQQPDVDAQTEGYSDADARLRDEMHRLQEILNQQSESAGE